MINPKLGSFHKDQLLAVLFNFMSQDLRQKLMLECPAAYNDACGDEIVQVYRVSDSSPIVPGVHRTTIVTLGTGNGN